MNISRTKQRSGFTFVEIIIYVFIMSTVVFTATLFIWQIYGNGAKSQAYREVYDNIDFITARITREIHRSSLLTQISSSQIDVSIPNGESQSFYFDPNDKSFWHKRAGFEAERLSSSQVEVTGYFSSQSDAYRSRNVGVYMDFQYKSEDLRNDFLAQGILETSIELLAR